MYESIPQELKSLKQWVCWMASPDESRPGRIKKTPVNARTGGNAQSNNSDTWCDFDTAVRASSRYSGIGLMFANGYFGVDIDHVEDALAEYMGLEPQYVPDNNVVAEFIFTLQSYCELSVSGTGLHILCKGSLPPTGRRKGNVEMYSEGRFFIMTGRAVSEYTEVVDCTESIKALHEKYIGGGRAPTTGIVRREPVSLDDAEVIRIASNSKRGRLFQDLYNGQWDGYYASQSEADMALCNMLAFYCRKDEVAMDRIFRGSGLMREKWDRKQAGSTYGALTVHKAASTCANVYEPKPEYHITIGGGVPPPPEPKLYSFDDTGNAQRFTDRFGPRMRYSYVDKRWMYYDGRKWCTDMSGEVKRMADEVVDEMRGDLDFYMDHLPADADPDDFQKQILKHIKYCRSNRGKQAMVKETEHHVPILPSQLDRHNDLLNTLNGIINLRSGDLVPHDPERYLSRIAHAEYSDKVDCPLWESFLLDIFCGDTELIRYVQMAVGYSLTGSTQEQCAFFLYGTGKNGKTTFLEVITEILGDYAMNVQPTTLMLKPGGGAGNGINSDIARLKGARFVTSVEPNEGLRLDEGLLKQLTGGDRVTARKLYGEEFEFTPEFKLWMGTNHKPVIRGTDTGIWRRIHLIPFTAQIPESKRDARLKYKLRKEAQGIFKWMVDGCLLWQRAAKLVMPAAVRQAVKEYRDEMDVVSAFLEDCTTTGPGSAGATDLFQAYLRWAEENNEYRMSARKFGLEMGKKFNRIKSNGTKRYEGLILRESARAYAVRFGPR